MASGVLLFPGAAASARAARSPAGRAPVSRLPLQVAASRSLDCLGPVVERPIRRIRREAKLRAESVRRGRGWRASAGEGDPGSEGGGSAESLFARELRKRGLARPQPPKEEDSSPGAMPSQQPDSADPSAASSQAQSRFRSAGGDASAPSPPPPASSVSWPEGQQDRSRLLNSEGLEGLPARALVLIRLGASFYFNLWPLALLLVGVFVAVYLVWGSSFIHFGKPGAAAPPAYIDPYELLRQEQELVPMVPYRNDYGNYDTGVETYDLDDLPGVTL